MFFSGTYSYMFHASIQASTVKYPRTAFFWVITQGVAVISYRRFETTYLSHPQGSRIKKPEDGTDRLSRNVRKNYHYYLRNDPEERSTQLHISTNRKVIIGL
jgi:hypothetical protein